VLNHNWLCSNIGLQRIIWLNYFILHKIDSPYMIPITPVLTMTLVSNSFSSSMERQVPNWSNLWVQQLGEELRPLANPFLKWFHETCAWNIVELYKHWLLNRLQGVSAEYLPMLSQVLLLMFDFIVHLVESLPSTRLCSVELKWLVCFRRFLRILTWKSGESVPGCTGLVSNHSCSAQFL
jgi:hypothetical protein